MKNKGWIKLHRQIMENPFWLSEPFTRAQAWIDLLLLANHSTGHIRKRGILIEVQRGQVGYSEETLSKRWRWSRGKVRRFLEELKTDFAITRKSVQQNPNLSSLISITNYHIYQSDSTTGGTTNGQQTVQEQECKEGKEHIYAHFDKFYQAYPRKQGKQSALKAWVKNPELSNGLFNTVMDALEKQKTTWKDKTFIPYPATWLNGRRWEDEIEESKPVSGGWI